MEINYDAKTDDEFRQSVISYIKVQFADTLGDDVALLDFPNGLEIIKEKYGLNSVTKVA